MATRPATVTVPDSAELTSEWAMEPMGGGELQRSSQQQTFHLGLVTTIPARTHEPSPTRSKNEVTTSFRFVTSLTTIETQARNDGLKTASQMYR